MAEVTEYTLAVLVSALLIGGSAATYASFAGLEGRSEADAALSTMVTLAYEAVERGSASSNVLLPSGTVTCQAGALSLTTGNVTVSSAIPGACNFTAAVQGGVHEVVIESRSSGLVVEVS